MKASSARRATKEGAEAVEQTRRNKETAEAESRRQVIARATDLASGIYARLEKEIEETCAKGETSLETSFGNWWRDRLIPGTIAPILQSRLEDDGFTVEKCEVRRYKFQGSDESPVETHYSVRLIMNWRRS